MVLVRANVQWYLFIWIKVCSVGLCPLWPAPPKTWQGKWRSLHRVAVIPPVLHPQGTLAQPTANTSVNAPSPSGAALQVLLDVDRSSFCPTVFLEVPLTSHCSTWLPVLVAFPSTLAFPARTAVPLQELLKGKKSPLASRRKGEEGLSKAAEALRLADTLPFLSDWWYLFWWDRRLKVLMFHHFWKAI